MSPWAEAANLAAAGIAVFPLWSLRRSLGVDFEKCCCNEDRSQCRVGLPGRHPLHQGWRKVATSDPEAVATLAERHAGSNAGALCGQGGLSVLRINDPDALEAAEARFGRLPRTVESASPDGRRLLWLRDCDLPAIRADAVDGLTFLPWAPIPGSREPGGVHIWMDSPENLHFAGLPAQWLEEIAAARQRIQLGRVL